MNETSSTGLTGTATLSNVVYSGNTTAYLGTTIAATNLDYSGLTLQGNSTVNYSNNTGYSPAVTPPKKMAPKQINVAVFTITRDADTNEINSTKFVKQIWVEQKNGASIDLIVAKQLDVDFDPEFTIIKVLSTVSF